MSTKDSTSSSFLLESHHALQRLILALELDQELRVAKLPTNRTSDAKSQEQSGCDHNDQLETPDQLLQEDISTGSSSSKLDKELSPDFKVSDKPLNIQEKSLIKNATASEKKMIQF
ncbi:hypothetical protein SNE40_023238 [Patella caerulea]|uniref:Uncharacterized protein n=1 Tax=Patella caerulea TaxID=87958 RepID=A0AAN8FY29_PATCE